MRRLIWLVACLVAAVLFSQTRLAAAHILESDGTMSVILHVEPYDDPTARENSGLAFSFNDAMDRFTVNQCICQVEIKEDGRTLTKQTLIGGNLYGRSDFVFPRRDVYELILSGSPKVDGDFKPFKMTFLLRVASSAGLDPVRVQQSQGVLLWGVVSLGALGYLTYRQIRRGGRYGKPKK